MTMTHPGLPSGWGLIICLAMLLISVWIIFRPLAAGTPGYRMNIMNRPLIGFVMGKLTASHWPLLILKILVTAVFILIIVSGLLGTQIPERNIATVLTWNIWWTGLIISIFFLGSAWCAVCPWDAISTWLVRRRLYKRAGTTNSLDLTVPARFRNVWIALLLLIALTWLELGMGITTSPYTTALLALLMVVLATVSLAVFEKKAFCRNFCPVGRTIGVYSQLAPVELRPVNRKICNNCKTLECYHGSPTVEPCPTHLVMGRLKQNTYCTSCGNCVQSCPDHNVAWRLRPQSVEAVQTARPHWDEAWFMLLLLALTGFHGLSMLPFFENWVSVLGRILGDSGQLLWSFTLLLLAGLLVPALLYALVIALARWLMPVPATFRQVFSGFAFITLPLAFAYHIAHNLNHLVRENDGFAQLMANPMGIGAQPLSMMEKHSRHLDMLISENLLFALQAMLMIFGFWIAVKVIRHRGAEYVAAGKWSLAPLLFFAIGITSYHVWMLMQPMVMRM
jgi:polyferredoxin